jgi:predicted acetyltransferase
VPDHIYWAVDERGEYIGRISVRTELNVFLEKVGGHIGYDVRPTKRKRGYAKEMLRQVLMTEWSL